MIILIDDDKLIHLSWKLRASKANNIIEAYVTTDEFLNSNPSPLDELDIYIDSNLENGKKGEYEAKRLSDLGFKNIYLTTGYQDLKQEDYPWLKGIISKTPPF